MEATACPMMAMSQGGECKLCAAGRSCCPTQAYEDEEAYAGRSTDPSAWKLALLKDSHPSHPHRSEDVAMLIRLQVGAYCGSDTGH